MTLIKGAILANEKNLNTTIITKNAKQNLLRSAIIYAEKGNHKLICEISLKLGEINYEDFMFMDAIISKSFHNNEREEITKNLSKYLNGFKQARDNIYDYALLNM